MEGSLGGPRLEYYSFLDAAGRSWAWYNGSENIYVVDTNGMKEPNRFGKDRWLFTFLTKNKVRAGVGYTTGAKAYYYKDVTSKTGFCQFPPCYYKSWLIK